MKRLLMMGLGVACSFAVFGRGERWVVPQRKAPPAAGRTTEREFRKEFRHFIWQFGSIDNYWGHPMYLGGTRRWCANTLMTAAVR